MRSTRCSSAKNCTSKVIVEQGTFPPRQVAQPRTRTTQKWGAPPIPRKNWSRETTEADISIRVSKLAMRSNLESRIRTSGEDAVRLTRGPHRQLVRRLARPTREVGSGDTILLSFPRRLLPVGGLLTRPVQVRHVPARCSEESGGWNSLAAIASRLRRALGVGTRNPRILCYQKIAESRDEIKADRPTAANQPLLGCFLQPRLSSVVVFLNAATAQRLPAPGAAAARLRRRAWWL